MTSQFWVAQAFPTPLEIDEHLAAAGTGMSDSTRHHDVVALERLQKFAIQNKLLEKPAFGNLAKPRVGRRDRIPTLARTEAILTQASPAFPLDHVGEPASG